MIIQIKLPKHIRLMLQKTERKQGISMQSQIQTMLQDRYERQRKKVSQQEKIVTEIKEIVSKHYGIPTELYVSHSRKRELVEPRRAGMYFAKLHTKLSLRAIGEQFGGRDHSTVIHAVETQNNLLSYEKSTIELTKKIGQEIETLLSSLD